MRAGAGRRTLDGEDISAGLVNKEDLLLLLIVIVTVANITAMMHYSLKRDALKIFGWLVANGSGCFGSICWSVFRPLALQSFLFYFRDVIAWFEFSFIHDAPSTLAWASTCRGREGRRRQRSRQEHRQCWHLAKMMRMVIVTMMMMMMMPPSIGS